MTSHRVLGFVMILLIGIPAAGDCREFLEESCSTLAAIVRVYPALDVTKSAPVSGAQSGSESPAGCLIHASGPVSAVAGEVAPEDAVRELFGQNGWMEDPDYSADGPGTTMFALRKGEVLCIVAAGAPAAIEEGEIVTDEVYQFDAGCAAE